MSRSTRLSVLNRHCPWALYLHDSGVPRGGAIRFSPGKIAHAVLERLTIERPETLGEVQIVARRVMETAMGTGTTFDGVPEPQISPEDASEGRDLAMNAYFAHGLPPIGKAEVGLGMDELGNPAPYEGAFLRAAIDLLYFDELSDESEPMPVVVVRDYKSSWIADARELSTTQRKIQAVLAWIHYGKDVVAVRQEVLNLRTLAIYQESIGLDDAGEELLTLWKEDLLASCRALAQVMRNPIPAPGVCCSGCPWAYRCEFCMAASALPAVDDPKSVAMAYATAQVRRDILVAMAKELAKEGDIAIHGGMVGFYGQTEMKARPEAGKVILDYWLEGQGDVLGEARPLMESLLNAMKPSSGNIKALGKMLFQGSGSSKVATFKEDRAAFEEVCMEPKVRPVFSMKTSIAASDDTDGEVQEEP